MSLADDLDDWTDWDVAAYALGRILGLFHDADSRRVKHVVWTSNQLGDGLHDALLALVSAGMLDRREEPDEQFRRSGELGIRVDGVRVPAAGGFDRQSRVSSGITYRIELR